MLSRNDKEKANLNSREFLWVSANTHASAKQFFMDFSFHHQLQENSMQAINKEYLMNRRNSSFFFLSDRFLRRSVFFNFFAQGNSPFEFPKFNSLER